MKLSAILKKELYTQNKYFTSECLNRVYCLNTSHSSWRESWIIEMGKRKCDRFFFTLCSYKFATPFLKK